MSDQTVEISNQSRSVFDAILAWQDFLSRQSRSPCGFAQFTHALEGMLQDPTGTRYANHFNDYLWQWLFFASTLDSNEDAPDVFLSYLHASVRWLAFKATSRGNTTLPHDLPEDYRGLDWDRVKYQSQDSRKLFLIEELGNERVEQLVNDFRSDPYRVEPSTTAIKALQNVFLLEMRDNMTAAVLDSEFGRLLLQSAVPNDAAASDTAVRDSQKSRTDNERSRIMLEADSHVTVRIRFLDPGISPTRAGRTLWSFGAALESIEGVAVSIEDWGKGSLWSDIKVFVSSLWRRDEVQEVLDKGRQAAVSHYLDRPTEEALKLAAERQKLDEERVSLKQKRLTEPDAEQKYRLLELQIREKEQDIRSKELENHSKAMIAIRQASELVRDGIVAADKVAIDVDGICSFLFDGSRVESKPIVLEDKSDDEHSLS